MNIKKGDLVKITFDPSIKTETFAYLGNSYAYVVKPEGTRTMVRNINPDAKTTDTWGLFEYEVTKIEPNFLIGKKVKIKEIAKKFMKNKWTTAKEETIHLKGVIQSLHSISGEAVVSFNGRAITWPIELIEIVDEQAKGVKVEASSLYGTMKQEIEAGDIVKVVSKEATLRSHVWPQEKGYLLDSYILVSGISKDYIDVCNHTTISKGIHWRIHKEDVIKVDPKSLIGRKVKIKPITMDMRPVHSVVNKKTVEKSPGQEGKIADFKSDDQSIVLVELPNFTCQIYNYLEALEFIDDPLNRCHKITKGSGIKASEVQYNDVPLQNPQPMVLPWNTDAYFNHNNALKHLTQEDVMNIKDIDSKNLEEAKKEVQAERDSKEVKEAANIYRGLLDNIDSFKREICQHEGCIKDIKKNIKSTQKQLKAFDKK